MQRIEVPVVYAAPIIAGLVREGVTFRAVVDSHGILCTIELLGGF